LSILATIAIVIGVLLVVWVARAAYRVSQPDWKPPEPKGRTESKTFYTKVAGVTKKNSDGERRQSIIKELSAGDRVNLIREPDNRYDPNAIRVDSSFGHIGYIPADTAANNLASQMDRGHKVYAVISEITGGEQGKPTRGVNLEIKIVRPVPSKKKNAA
jgi:hypothetical protein